MPTKKYSRRKLEEFVVGEKIDWDGSGVYPFRELRYKILRQLTANALIDTNKKLGINHRHKTTEEEAPTISEAKKFMEKHRGFKALGRLKRESPANLIFYMEGLSYSGYISRHMFKEFVKKFGNADFVKLKPTRLRCWYD